MNTGIANINVIQQILQQDTAKQLSDGTGIKIGTIKKYKCGERSVEKMNLADAIKLTSYGNSNKTAEITTWQK